MKSLRRLLLVPLLLSLALADPLAALGSDDECFLFQEFDQFTVLTRWTIDEPTSLSVGTNASILDDELCTSGVGRETFDSRIIPPATSQLQFGYHPFGPCGDGEECLGDSRCYNGVTLQLKLDGLGWDGAMVDMTCRGSYWTEWLTIPAGPEAAGTLIVTVPRNPQGLPESTQYHTGI